MLAFRNSPITQITRWTALLLSSALILFTGAAQADAQASSASVLPVNPPTAAALPAPIAATPVSPKDVAPRHRAKVTYIGGLLDVRADNSSLNGILRDISQVTGMKITGGVADQRVFGNYGPAEPSTVLATLLDGTGSNILLRETADNGPKELVLTPRSGGVTPPNPNAPGFDQGEDDDDQQQNQQPAPPTQAQPPTSFNQVTQPQAQTQPTTSGPQPIPQPFNNVLGSPSNTTPTASTLPTYNSIPTDALSTPSTAPPVSGIVDSTNPPPSGSTTFGSSTPTNINNLGDGTAKTPEQIFQQLQQLRQQSAQQQQQQQSGTTPTTPATTTQPQ